MPGSELFWANFTEIFAKALGVSLGMLPAIAAFWGGIALFAHVLNRPAGHDVEARRRVDTLERRVLDFESHRPREGRGA